MSNGSIDGVLITPLKVVEVAAGDVLHAMKSTDKGAHGFGEAYFSTVELGAIKGWKRHNEMTMNLVVPIGAVRFVIYDSRPESMTFGEFQEVTLSRNNYCRLTVPPMVWVGFQNIGETVGLLLNIADIMHRADEVDRLSLSEICYEWEN